MRTRNILICFRISEHWDHVLGRFCQVSFKPYAFRQHSLIRRRSSLVIRQFASGAVLPQVDRMRQSRNDPAATWASASRKAILTPSCGDHAPGGRDAAQLRLRYTKVQDSAVDFFLVRDLAQLEDDHAPREFWKILERLEFLLPIRNTCPDIPTFWRRPHSRRPLHGRIYCPPINSRRACSSASWRAASCPSTPLDSTSSPALTLPIAPRVSSGRVLAFGHLMARVVGVRGPFVPSLGIPDLLQSLRIGPGLEQLSTEIESAARIRRIETPGYTAGVIPARTPPPQAPKKADYAEIA